MRRACIDEALRLIRQLADSNPSAVVCVEGRCASGKSTFALRLRDMFGFEIIRADDFFLQPFQRTPERYAQPGGNIDYERFRTEVADKLRLGLDVEYRPFECRRMDFGQAVKVPCGRPRVVEGSYSMHPYFGKYYDFAVFMSVCPEQQLRRIEARGGSAVLQNFKTRWIPLEEKYFDSARPWQNADLYVDTSESDGVRIAPCAD